MRYGLYIALGLVAAVPDLLLALASAAIMI
jgi:hypothetical protein